MRFCRAAGTGCGIAVLFATTAFTQVSVLTYHNDNSRTGANTNETILTPFNVNTNTFGLLFSHDLDGYVYPQPLYVSGVNIPGSGVHNVIFVATEHNSLYAFDADSNTGPNGGLLWHTNFGPSATTPNFDFGYRWGFYFDIAPEIGILSTPVIDPDTGTIYVEALTHEGNSYIHRMHALNITNGVERPFGPVVVSASVPGIGVDSVNGTVTFNAIQQSQRPALTLAGGVVYAAYASYGDTDPYHGWVIGFDAQTLEQRTNYVFNTTPNSAQPTDGPAGEGGIWMSGCGLSVDSKTNLYVVVGNGVFDAALPGGTEFGDSVVKLSTTNGLSVADWFTPWDQETMAENDLDLGSGGAVLLPDSAGDASHRHLLLTCGKEGNIYLLDRQNLGQYQPASNSQIVQEVPYLNSGMWGTLAYYNGLVYFQGVNNYMVSLSVAGGKVATTPNGMSTTAFGYPGCTPSISADGEADAIVWALQTDAYSEYGASGPAVLHAYDAYDIATELYNSAQAGTRDQAGAAVKFAVPTVANGKVFVGSQYSLCVYGLGNFIAAPVISPSNRMFTNTVSVTISEATPGAAVFYTLDGSAPGTNSIPYTGPFVLTGSTPVNAIAFKSGAVPSRVTTTAFGIAASPYRDAMLAANPVAYWRFSETNSPVAFDYVGHYDAAYGIASTVGAAGPSFPTYPGFGTNNHAVQIGGSQSWVTAPPLNLNTNTVTIVAWLYPDGPQNDYTPVFESINNPDTEMFHLMSGNQLAYSWNNNDPATWTFASGLTVPIGQWSFVGLVISPSAATLYCGTSGTLQSATNAIPHYPGAFSGVSRIGDYLGLVGRDFNGVIDEVAVFNRSLSNAEVQQIYAAGTTVPVFGLNSQITGGNMTLNWPFGHLEQASSPYGPWSAVTGAAGSFTAPMTNQSWYFRVRDP